MIEILFENDDCLAVNKPEGIASIPERQRGKASVLEQLSASGRERLYVVHRLDKEASGVLVFAKNAEAHRHLCRQFTSHEIEKVYLALVHGVVADDAGVIEKPLRQFGSGRMGVDLSGVRGQGPGIGGQGSEVGGMRQRPVGPRSQQKSKASVTKYRVVERFREYTQLEVRPITGRRHQIRVHLYSIGHPIVGDVLYGDRAVQSQFARMMLHAQRLRLRLPSGEEVTIEAKAPESFSGAENDRWLAGTDG